MNLAMSVRFFFPDSPTSAWFLTPDERVAAVQRIKVSIFGHHPPDPWY